MGLGSCFAPANQTKKYDWYIHIFDMVYTDMLPKESNGFRANWWKPRVKGKYRKSDAFW